ncbi:MAG: hypothetical protein KDB07_09905, partial [Planctomycetes bacterium]|nr:hypothetical protein [Planctomycetota bacterium]
MQTRQIRGHHVWGASPFSTYLVAYSRDWDLKLDFASFLLLRQRRFNAQYRALSELESLDFCLILWLDQDKSRPILPPAASSAEAQIVAERWQSGRLHFLAKEASLHG